MVKRTADGRGRSFQLILAPEASFPSMSLYLLFASRAAMNSFSHSRWQSTYCYGADTDAHITETRQFSATWF
jgi:hypothetical protein